MQVTLKQNKDRKNTSDRYPMVFKISHQRRRVLIYTGIHVCTQEFDEQAQRLIYVKGISNDRKDIREKNLQLRQMAAIIKEVVEKHKEKKTLELKDISRECKRCIRKNSLYSVFEEAIKEKKGHGAIGSARAYESTYNKIRHLTEGKDIPLYHLSSDYIHKLYRQCCQSGISTNTIAFYMRNLKTVINRGSRKSGKAMPSARILFDGIVIRKEKTRKRALTEKEMQKLIHYTPQENEWLMEAKAIFLLCFLLQGTGLADLCFMKKEAMQGNYICYKRHKTNIDICVALSDESQRLAQRFMSKDDDSPFLFCFMDGQDTPQKCYTRYRSLLKKQNRNLKQIGYYLGIGLPLTSYVARHTWASQAKESGAPTELISEAMGHTSQHTTAIYLKKFNQSSIDQVNDIVTAPYRHSLHQLLYIH